jgi:hypothetical protein
VAVPPGGRKKTKQEFFEYREARFPLQPVGAALGVLRIQILLRVGNVFGLISTRGPAVVARADTNVLAEAPRAMALIRKAGRYCNLRKRKVGSGEQLHGAFDPTSDQIVVRRHSYGFLERAREMKRGQARNTGKHVDADLLAKVRIDVLADPAQSLRRKAAPYARDRRGADGLVGDVDESRTSRRRGSSDCAGRLARQR